MSYAKASLPLMSMQRFDFLNMNTLHCAVCQNKKDLVKSFLAQGVDINSTNENGETPLHVASFSGFTDMVKYLLKNNADMTITCLRGNTALFSALKHHKYETAKVLLRHGSDSIIDLTLAKIHWKYAQLCESIIKGDSDAVKRRLEKAKDVNFPGVKKETPLFWAVFANRPALVKMLIDKGADVNQRNFLNCKPVLHLAVEEDNLEMLRYLLSHDVDLECTIDIHCGAVTPLFLAAIEEQPEMMRLLLRNGANVNARNTNRDQTALHYVSEYEDTAFLELLFEYEVKIDATDRFGQTVLHYAARNEESAGPLKFLLERDAVSVNHRDKGGNTPLNDSFFSRSSYCTNFALLLEYGADINVPNNEGDLPRILSTCTDHSCPVLALLNKFKLLGFEVSDSLKKRFVGNLYFHERDERLSNYKQELELMKKIVINTYPRTTLYDVLVMRKFRLTRYAANRKLADIFTRNLRDFQREFPHYGFLLNLKFKKGLKRRALIDGAKVSLNSLLGTSLPEVSTDRIFKYFNDAELRNFNTRLLADNLNSSS